MSTDTSAKSLNVHQNSFGGYSVYSVKGYHGFCEPHGRKWAVYGAHMRDINNKIVPLADTKDEAIAMLAEMKPVTFGGN